jgi:hypothetical protein
MSRRRPLPDRPAPYFPMKRWARRTDQTASKTNATPIHSRAINKNSPIAAKMMAVLAQYQNAVVNSRLGIGVWESVSDTA